MKTLSSLCEDDDDDDVECWAEPGWAGRQSRSWSILVSVGKLISVIRVISIIYPGRGRHTAPGAPGGARRRGENVGH